MKLKVYKDGKGEYRWTAIARNGKKTADSAEGYKTKRNAVRAANSHLEQVVKSSKVVVED